MRFFLILLAVALVVAVARADERSDTALQLRITATATEIRAGERFTLGTVVENVGAQDQVIDVWSCSYAQQFQSDAAVIVVEMPGCTRNGLRHLRLVPGETLEAPLQITARPEGGAERAHREIRFRLGFHPLNAPDAALFWSNPLTVSVRS